MSPSNKFYGSCVACTYRDAHVTSDSSPTILIGESIFFDLQVLSSPSIGGNTQVFTFVDDHSRYFTVLGAKSEDRDDIMTCILQRIAMYNAQDFSPRHIAWPPSYSNHQTTPDSHCHKAERHTTPRVPGVCSPRQVHHQPQEVRSRLHQSHLTEYLLSNSRSLC